MAFTKAGLWGPQAIIDATGHPQPGATATLYLPDEVTLASLWTTSAKSVAAPNPTQADIHANLHFWTDPGQYRLRVNVGTVVTWLDVEVPIDPGEAAQDQDVTAAIATAEAYADGIVAAALAAALAGSQPLDADLTAIAALSTTAYGRAFLALADAAAGRTALGLGTAATHAVGDFDAAGAAAAATAALVNSAPGTLDTLNELATALADDPAFATTMTNALAGKQPLDSDLTAIAALSTTAFGRSALALADSAALRVLAGTVIGTDVQAHDSDLDAIAALATTAFGRALLVLADAAALRTAAGLGTAATAATTDFDAAGTASAAITALINGAPGALDTLNELATALGDDAAFATTVTNALATKLIAGATSGSANQAALPAAVAHTHEIVKTDDGGVYLSTGSSWVQLVAPSGTYAGALTPGDVAIPTTQKGAASGVATLDASGKVTRAQDRSPFAVADNGLFVSTSGNDNNDGLSPGGALATLDAAIAKLPTPNFAFGPTRRGYLISLMPGDYTLAGPLTVKKGPNLEIRGIGSRGQAATPGYGGTNIFTPVGQVGLTIGQRNTGDTAWSSVKTGLILRNLHFAPAATDTGATTGLKIIGLSNCTFYDVAVSNYIGAASVGWHMQSSLIANGGSGGSTSYDTFYSCSVNDCMTGLWMNGQTGHLVGFLADGNDDIVTGYTAGSKAILLDNGGSIVAIRPIIQAYETGIDDSQTHGAGVLYSLIVVGAHFEALGTGVISNQIGTLILGGTFDNSNLSGGTAGTTAFQFNSGASGFVVEGVEIGAVGTKFSVDAAASGWRKDSTGAYVYGTGTGRGIPTYNGGTPTGAVGAPAGSGASFGSFSAGSTDMAGRFTFTTGSGTTAGNAVTVTFANAFGTGVIPVVLAQFTSTSSTNSHPHVASISNTGWSFYVGSALATSTTYTVDYALLGQHT